MIKKAIVITALILLMLGLKAFGYEKNISNCDFETYHIGDTPKEFIFPASASQGMKIIDDSSNKVMDFRDTSDYVYFVLPQVLEGKYSISAKIKFPVNYTRFNFFLVGRGGEATVESDMVQSGRIRHAYYQNSTSTTKSYATIADGVVKFNSWFQLEFKVDTVARTFETYIDGQKVGQTQPLAKAFGTVENQQVYRIAMANRTASEVSSFHMLLDDIAVKKEYTITSVDTTIMNILKGDSFVFPNEISVNTLSDGIQKTSVIWDNPTLDTAVAGSYTVTGQISGYSQSVAMTVNVLEPQMSSISDSKASIAVGEPLVTPAKAEVLMNDGSKRMVDVIWNSQGFSTLSSGVFHIQGTAVDDSLNVGIPQTIFQDTMNYPLGTPKPVAIPGLTISSNDANTAIAYEALDPSNKVVQIGPGQSLYSNVKYNANLTGNNVTIKSKIKLTQLLGTGTINSSVSPFCFQIKNGNDALIADFFFSVYTNATGGMIYNKGLYLRGRWLVGPTGTATTQTGLIKIPNVTISEAGSDSWINLRVVLNTVAKTYHVYVNDVKVLSNINFYTKNITSDTTVMNIKTFAFADRNGATLANDMIIVDDVEFQVPAFNTDLAVTVYEQSQSDLKRVGIVKDYLDFIMQKARDRSAFDFNSTPVLFADGIDVVTSDFTKWNFSDGSKTIMTNLAAQQNLMRTLIAMSTISKDSKYVNAAKDNFKYYFDHFQDTTGLLQWGGHTFVDYATLKPYGGVQHELKDHFPVYDLMKEVDSEKTEKYIQSVWTNHMLNWSTLESDRHAYGSNWMPVYYNQWNSIYGNPPMPVISTGISFLNAANDYLYAATQLFNQNQKVKDTYKNLENSFIATRNPTTKLMSFQFTECKKLAEPPTDPNDPTYTNMIYGDRAQRNFPEIPGIREWNTLISSDQVYSVYCTNPLIQLETAKKVSEAERTAIIDDVVTSLEAYYDYAYIPATNKFMPIRTDGTSMDGYVLTTYGYYGAAGTMLKAWPATGDYMVTYMRTYINRQTPKLWAMVRNMATANGLGDLGTSAGVGMNMNFNTDCDDDSMLIAITELYDFTRNDSYLQLARRIADNICNNRYIGGYFMKSASHLNVELNQSEPLALLQLDAAIKGIMDTIPVYLGKGGQYSNTYKDFSGANKTIFADTIWAQTIAVDTAQALINKDYNVVVFENMEKYSTNTALPFNSNPFAIMEGTDTLNVVAENTKNKVAKYFGTNEFFGVKTPAEQSGLVIVKSRIKLNSYCDNFMMNINNIDGYKLVEITLGGNGGIILTTANETGVESYPVLANGQFLVGEWFEIRVELNTTYKTFDLFINNRKIGDGTYKFRNYYLTECDSNISAVWFADRNPTDIGTFSAYIDNILVAKSLKVFPLLSQKTTYEFKKNTAPFALPQT